jgi:transposase-like protein
VDKEGHTIDFLLTPSRDRDAAEAFLHKAIRNQQLPEKSTLDQSGATTAAIKRYNKTHKTAIIIRHAKYLNNIVEVRLVGQKPNTHRVWGIGPGAWRMRFLRPQNLIPVSV